MEHFDDVRLIRRLEIVFTLFFVSKNSFHPVSILSADCFLENTKQNEPKTIKSNKIDEIKERGKKDEQMGEKQKKKREKVKKKKKNGRKKKKKKWKKCDAIELSAGWVTLV